MKNLFGSFAASIVIQLVTLISGILTARLLLPAGRGELAAIILWPSLLAYVCSLGLTDAVAFYVADANCNAAKVLTSGLTIGLFLSIVVLGIGWVILPLVWGNKGMESLETARLYLSYIPLNLVAMVLMGALWGQMRLADFNFLRTFVHIGYTTGIVLLYLVGQVSVRLFVEASLIANLATMLIAIGMVWKSHWLIWQPAMQMVRRLLGYGVRVHLGTIASMANLRLDQLLMSIFLASQELGLYVVAVSVSSLANLAAGAIVFVTFPRITNLVSEPEKKQALGRFVRLTLLLSVLTAGSVFGLAPWLLDTFFSSLYLPASMMARILVVAAIPLGFNMVLGAGLRALGRPLISSQAELTGLGVTAIALAVLLPRYGALGAAWASLIAYSTVSVFLLYVLRKQLGITVVELLHPTVADWDYVVGSCGTLSIRIKKSFNGFFPEHRN